MGNRRKRFLFSADVSGLAPNTGYTVIINRGEQAENMTLHSDGTGKMNIAAGLAHEESITIIGVPVGAQCKIRERSGLYPAYNTAWEYQYRDQSGTVCSFAQDTQEMKNMMPESRDGELAECIWTADPAQEDAVLTCINDRDQTIPAGVLARPLTLSAGMVGAIAAIMAFLLAVICFIIFSLNIGKQIEKQNNIINTNLGDVQSKIQKIDKQTEILKNKISIYDAIINNKPFEKSRIISKDSIPNLLNKIMFIIPGEVQLTLVKNTEKNHIEIEAISLTKEDLQKFFESIKSDGMLKNMEMNYLDSADNYKVLIEKNFN